MSLFGIIIHQHFFQTLPFPMKLPPPPQLSLAQLAWMYDFPNFSLCPLPGSLLPPYTRVFCLTEQWQI